MSTLTGLREGVDVAEGVRIVYEIKGVEHVALVEAADTAHGPLLDALLVNLTVPVTAVRAYKGTVLLEERGITARGN